MKRLSVGFQGTVDHRHRVKIQRREGTRGRTRARAREIVVRAKIRRPAKNERDTHGRHRRRRRPAVTLV